MPHYRERYVKSNILKTLDYSPLIGILGHRQVGKTTLVESITENYHTFDDEETYREALKSPKNFLSGIKGSKVGLDECQLVPGLFPALKEVIRKNKTPGQFLMTGSVRFTSRKAIRESLTGRLINHELLPFTISEIKHLSLSNFCLQLLSRKIRSQDELQTLLPQDYQFDVDLEIEKYLIRGGLPSLLFTREEQVRERKLLDQLNTILDRDIRLIYPTNIPYIQLFDFLRELAVSEGQPINFSEIQRQIKISDTTQKKLIYSLESVFLIRIIPLMGGKRNYVIRFEDQAESRYLRSLDTEKRDLIIELEGFLFRHIRAQFVYRLGSNFNFFHYQTRGGARIPIAVQTPEGVLGFLMMEDEHPQRHHLASAMSFLKAYSNSKIVYVTRDSKVKLQLLDSRSFVIPLKFFI